MLSFLVVCLFVYVVVLLYYIFTAYYADVHVRAVGSLYGYVDLKQVFLYFFKQSLEDVCHAQVQQESSF